MRFSVITPNYNSAAYLEQTIQSVLKQRRDVELEYIIVDGGSRDGSIDIINQYRTELAHCIIEPDNGPADAINKGFALATGEVVSWLNGDDLYYANTLARIQAAMDKSTEASMFFGGCPIIDEQGLEIRSNIANSDMLEAMAYVLRRQGRWQEALDALQRAAESSPKNDANLLDIASTCARVSPSIGLSLCTNTASASIATAMGVGL